MVMEHQHASSPLKRNNLKNEKKTYQELVGNSPTIELSFSDADLVSKISGTFDAIIVLDDDPTGTQTVHDIPVLTEWSEAAISNELDRGTQLFYILTNSRSFTTDVAKDLGLEIASNIHTISSAKGKKCMVISRSDSTLRGHYPMEIDLLMGVFKPKHGVQFILPAFLEGGRFTINDIHYVQEGDYLIPAGETPFAQDKVFGYTSSDLKDWVIEKSAGKIDMANIHTLSISELENETWKNLSSKIDTFKPNDVCIVNVSCHEHLKKAVYSILNSRVDPYFRSAASLVSTLAIQSPKIVDLSTLSLDVQKGGLTVLGSYVPKSTSQLAHVLDNLDIEAIKIDINSLLNGNEDSVDTIARKVDTTINEGNDVIIYTSRELISEQDSAKNLKIGLTISTFLTDIVSKLTVQPSYIIGKGGITSSDLATKSLRIKRAIVLGQMITGVPVWKPQADSKFPDTPFIVFPGNVGDHTGLTQVIKKLSTNS